MLRSRLNEALKESMKAKDERALSTLRLISAALKDRDIAARTRSGEESVSDDEILQMLQSMIKQRRESIALYEQGGRLELAQQEQEEIDVIQRFLPRQMSDEEVDAAVSEVITDLGASSLKDMGRVMTALRERFAGQMDFGKASQAVKTQLAA